MTSDDCVLSFRSSKGDGCRCWASAWNLCAWPQSSVEVKHGASNGNERYVLAQSFGVIEGNRRQAYYLAMKVQAQQMHCTMSFSWPRMHIFTDYYVMTVWFLLPVAVSRDRAPR